jgi:hypothetical protein
MAKFKKGSKAAKDFMAKLRAKKNKGATKGSQKKQTAKKTSEKRAKRPTKKQKSVSVMANHYLKNASDKLSNQFGQLSIELLHASTKVVKRGISKKIKEVKRKISAIKKIK